MKISEIKISDICSYIREMEEDLTEEEIKLLEGMKSAALMYCIGHTGLSEIDIEKHEDITIAVLVLISDMWDNRSMTVERNNVNKVVDSILGLYSVNLL